MLVYLSLIITVLGDVLVWQAKIMLFSTTGSPTYPPPSHGVGDIVPPRGPTTLHLLHAVGRRRRHPRLLGHLRRSGQFMPIYAEDMSNFARKRTQRWVFQSQTNLQMNLSLKWTYVWKTRGSNKPSNEHIGPNEPSNELVWNEPVTNLWAKVHFLFVSTVLTTRKEKKLRKAQWNVKKLHEMIPIMTPCIPLSLSSLATAHGGRRPLQSVTSFFALNFSVGTTFYEPRLGGTISTAQ